MALLTEKWEKELGSTKFPAINESAMSDMALILENTKAEEKLINERTESGDIAQFTPILIPLVRRVYPTLVANYIAGVQAIKTPTAYMYALVYKYNNTTANPLGSSEQAQILSLSVATTVGATLVGDTSGATGTVLYIENGGKTALVKITNAKLFEIEDVNTAATAVTATWSNEAQFQKVLTEYAGQYTTAAAEDLTTDMSEVGFDIQRTMVEAKSAKLKGKYTLEMYQDLKAMHDIDAEKEIMNLMQLELAWETDRKVVNFVNSSVNAASDVTISAYDGRWEIEKYRVLGIKISNEGREVGKLVRKGSANTLLVTPKTSVALEAIGSFITSNVSSTVDASKGGFTADIGTFDKRYKTIVDNFSDSAEYANVMYKGESNKDAGTFMAVYNGASFIKTVIPESGQPAVILSSRYGLVKNPLSPENYGKKFNVNFSSTALA